MSGPGRIRDIESFSLEELARLVERADRLVAEGRISEDHPLRDVARRVLAEKLGQPRPAVTRSRPH